jgi:hypothetical protein
MEGWLPLREVVITRATGSVVCGGWEPSGIVSLGSNSLSPSIVSYGSSAGTRLSINTIPLK